jgi:hypothetical protein
MRRSAVMMQGRIVAAAAVAIYLLGAPGSARSQTPPACPNATFKYDEAVLEVTADKPTLVVTLTRAPITRLRLSLDQIDSGRGKHVELEWEPNLPDTLVKRVALAEGRWHVSFWAEPILRVESNSGQSFYIEMNLNCFNRDKGTELKAEAKVFNALPAANADAGTNAITYPALRAILEAEALPDMVSASNLGSAGPLYELREVQGRGLADPIPPGVQEAFQLLAEIALDRAKSRGIDVLRRRLYKRLCKELTWGSLLDEVNQRFHIAKLPNREEQLLPRTCSVLQSLRLQDLASSGRTVLRALREDFARSVVPFFAQVLEERLGWNPELARVYDKLVPIAVEVAAGNRPTKEQARLLLIELSRQDWIRDALLAQLAAAQDKALRTHADSALLASHDQALVDLNEDRRDLLVELASAQGFPDRRIREEIERKIAAIDASIAQNEKAQAAAATTIEQERETHGRLYARIRVAFALYDELRQAEFIAPAMHLLGEDDLKAFVRIRYAVDANLRNRIAVSLSAHLSETLLRKLVTDTDCHKDVSTLGKADLIECVRNVATFAAGAIGTLLEANLEDIRHTVDDVLLVKSWHDFTNLSDAAREIIFRAMVVRAVEASRAALLDAADASLLRRATEALRDNASALLNPDEKQRLATLLDDDLAKVTWNTAETVEVRRQWAIFLNGFTSARRLAILRDALAGGMLDRLVSDFFGGGGPDIKLAGAIADPEGIIARLTQWGLDQIRTELAGKDFRPAVGCGLQLAFAVLSKCVGEGSCTTNQISEIFREPHAHFKAAVEGLHAMCWDAGRFIDLGEVWPDLDVFASKVVTVFFPESGATGTEMATAAADVFFDIALRLACRGPAERCRDDKNARMLQTLHAIVHAMLQHDVGTVLVETSHLVEQYLLDGSPPGTAQTTKALHKATALIGAIAAYASTFDSNAEDADALAAAREARKRALESLIDTATDRSGRHGDTLVSIGANVGFSVLGHQWLRDTGGPGFVDFFDGEFQSLRLQLPMGIAVQHVLDREDREEGLLCNKNIGCGFHLQLSLVDLGQFLASSEGEFKEVTPRDFVTVGLQAGFIVGSPSMPFVIGADVHWAPSLFPRTYTEKMPCGDDGTCDSTTQSGAIQLGFFVSYYVPFFDIN